MTLLGWLSDPFKWLSDLQVGDEKVALNHLVFVIPFLRSSLKKNDLQEVMEQQTVSVAILGWTVKDFLRLLSGVNKKSTGRWWFQIFFNGQLSLGKWSNLTNIVSNGLKPATRNGWGLKIDPMFIVQKKSTLWRREHQISTLEGWIFWSGQLKKKHTKVLRDFVSWSTQEK